MMYCDPNCKPWTSRHWAPEGFASRRDFVEQGRAAEAHKPLALEEARVEKVGGAANGGGRGTLSDQPSV